MTSATEIISKYKRKFSHDPSATSDEMEMFYHLQKVVRALDDTRGDIKTLYHHLLFNNGHEMQKLAVLNCLDIIRKNINSIIPDTSEYNNDDY